MTAVEYTKTVINGLKTWVVKQIGKAKSELSEQIVQADWNQNDETAADYVKNRTHYMISPAIIEAGYTITLPAWVNAESEHDEIPFALGQVWSTNYSDYMDLPVQQADDGTLYIGTYPDVINTPFYITSTKMKPNSSWLSAAAPDACVLTCTNAGGEYKTIPEKYFPDTIFRQSNAPVKYGTDANGDIIKTATVQGLGTTASGVASHAEGQTTTASSHFSHAEGLSTKASGYVSHAEGSGTTASGSYSHAEGSGTTASGSYSHAEGSGTTASGSYSHAEGSGTTANARSQHVQGEYNILDTGGNASTRGTYAHIVGNGTSGSKRSNAHTLDWSGNAWFAGNVTVGSGKSVLATVTAVNTKYTKPTSGIPKTDLASDVQASLNRADTLTDEYINNLISAALEAQQSK